MKAEASTPVQCQRHARPESTALEFLLITDQVDSSSNPHNDVRPRTERHFNELIPALPASAIVVKNIGDSLMVHVRMAASELPGFLDSVLAAKAALDDEQPDPDDITQHKPSVCIRIVMVYLAPNEYLCGHEIRWKPTSKPTADVPRGRTDNCLNWLCGDLFGSGITLAFRASGIPKSGIVVIDDRIVSQWKAESPAGCFSHSLNESSSLWFGPALAFSPFKGLEEIYNFGGDGPVAQSNWKGHLFMRMVDRQESDVACTLDNALVKDQQQVRVFTEVVWVGPAPDCKCAALVKALEEKQKQAGYIRNYGRVLETVEFPLKTLSHDADLILIGAYPSAEAYAVIREELGRTSLVHKTGFAYPVTNQVYPDDAEMGEAFLLPGGLTEKYVLVFARWKVADRLNGASTARNRLTSALKRRGLNRTLTIANCGLIQGNLWDVYALFRIIGDTAQFKKKQLGVLSKCVEEQDFEAATLKLCQSMPSNG